VQPNGSGQEACMGGTMRQTKQRYGASQGLCSNKGRWIYFNAFDFSIYFSSYFGVMTNES
jgi:hypothetical protein